MVLRSGAVLREPPIRVVVSPVAEFDIKKSVRLPSHRRPYFIRCMRFMMSYTITSIAVRCSGGNRTH